jgi:fructose-1,6-bisphosphatase I
MAEQFDVDAPTLNRFVMASSHDHDLVILMNAIATSCKLITSAVQRAGIAKLYGLAGETNSTGDDQKKLDVLANDMMINSLVNSGVCSVLVSEENEDPIIVPRAKAGKFCVAFDPLDGSSNIDCNVSVGTIFSVYERIPGSDGNVSDILRSGAHCICSGYVVYSSAVEMVFTFRGGKGTLVILTVTNKFLHNQTTLIFLFNIVVFIFYLFVYAILVKSTDSVWTAQLENLFILECT